jgi:hypothetical protein
MVIPSLQSLPKSIWTHTSAGVYAVARGAKATRNFLCSKTRNAVKANVLPLSNPPDWTDKMEAAKEKLGRLKWLETAKGRQINTLASDGPFHLPANTRNTIQQQQVEILKEQDAKLKNKIETQKQFIGYLKKERTVLVGSRFIRYIGMASNAMILGSGPTVGAALTAFSIGAREWLVYRLPEDPTIKPQEKRNTHCANLVTLGCYAVSISLSRYVLPVIKSTWKSYT